MKKKKSKKTSEFAFQSLPVVIRKPCLSDPKGTTFVLEFQTDPDDLSLIGVTQAHCAAIKQELATAGIGHAGHDGSRRMDCVGAPASPGIHRFYITDKYTDQVTLTRVASNVEKSAQVVFNQDKKLGWHQEWLRKLGFLPMGQPMVRFTLASIL